MIFDCFKSNSITARQAFGLTILLAAIWCLDGAFTGELLSGDETRVAGISAEMYYSGDWVEPRLNGKPFLEYPPFFYQWTAISFHLFGCNAVAAKLPAALAAFLGALLLFGWARKLNFSATAAMWSSFFLVSSAQYFSNGRICRVDMLLACCIVAALYGFTIMVKDKQHSLRGWLLLALGIFGGIFTKGLIGAALPAAGIGSFLLFDDFLKRRFSFRRYWLTATAFLTALLPVAYWLYLLYHRGGAEAVNEVVIVNNFGRFSGSQGDHVSPFYDYLLQLPGQFQPYLILVFAGLYAAFQKVRRERSSIALFQLCCLLVPFLLLNLASSKRQVYLLPLAFPCALLAGYAVEFFLLNPETNLKLPETCHRIWKKLCPTLPLLLVVAGLIANGIDATVLYFRSKKDSTKVCFLEAEKIAETEKRELTLYNPPERTSGAANFYLQRKLPVLSVNAYDGKSRILVILRDKKRPGKTSYGDDHWVFRLPEQQEKLHPTL